MEVGNSRTASRNRCLFVCVYFFFSIPDVSVTTPITPSPPPVAEQTRFSPVEQPEFEPTEENEDSDEDEEEESSSSSSVEEGNVPKRRAAADRGALYHHRFIPSEKRERERESSSQHDKRCAQRKLDGCLTVRERRRREEEI